MTFGEKYDKPLYGLIAGGILPVIGYFLSYLVKYYPKSFATYCSLSLESGNNQTQIFTFSMIPSLFLFYFILFRWKMEKASKTFVGISIIYVTIYVYLNFLG